MDCPFLKQTGAYLDRELPDSIREQFAAHLPGCDQCAQEVTRLKRVSGFLSGAARPEFDAQRTLWKVRSSRHALERFAKVLTAAAAVVILVCGTWLLRSADRSEAAVASPNWERILLTQQFDAPAPNEPDDPMVQVLLREQP